LTSSFADEIFDRKYLYMLMTVLKGELATKQSKALIRTFKKMKDYIIGNQGLIGQGLYPSWDAQNMISVHLAEKLKLPGQIPG